MDQLSLTIKTAQTPQKGEMPTLVSLIDEMVAPRAQNRNVFGASDFDNTIVTAETGYAALVDIICHGTILNRNPQEFSDLILLRKPFPNQELAVRKIIETVAHQGSSALHDIGVEMDLDQGLCIELLDLERDLSTLQKAYYIRMNRDLNFSESDQAINQKIISEIGQKLFVLEQKIYGLEKVLRHENLFGPKFLIPWARFLASLKPGTIKEAITNCFQDGCEEEVIFQTHFVDNPEGPIKTTLKYEEKSVHRLIQLNDSMVSFLEYIREKIANIPTLVLTTNLKGIVSQAIKHMNLEHILDREYIAGTKLDNLYDEQRRAVSLSSVLSGSALVGLEKARRMAHAAFIKGQPSAFYAGDSLSHDMHASADVLKKGGVAIHVYPPENVQEGDFEKLRQNYVQRLVQTNRITIEEVNRCLDRIWFFEQSIRSQHGWKSYFQGQKGPAPDTKTCL